MWIYNVAEFRTVVATHLHTFSYGSRILRLKVFRRQKLFCIREQLFSSRLYAPFIFRTGNTTM